MAQVKKQGNPTVGAILIFFALSGVWHWGVFVYEWFGRMVAG